MLTEVGTVCDLILVLSHQSLASRFKVSIAYRYPKVPTNESDTVLLQAMKEDPPLDARCRDKFLVQSVSVPSDDDSNIAALWSSIEKTNKAAIQEKKIRVHFLPASGTSTNGVSQTEENPPAYVSSSPTKFGSPAPATEHRSVTIDPTTEKTRSPTYDSPETSSSSGVFAAVTNAIPTSQDELKQQLADAQAQISKLTGQLADPQVRQRKVQEASEKVQTVVQQTNETGVPLQIVAGLCLLSFLIAYLFF